MTTIYVIVISALVAAVGVSSAMYLGVGPVGQSRDPVAGVPSDVRVLLWETGGQPTRCNAQIVAVAEKVPMDFGLECSAYWLVLGANETSSSLAADVQYFETHKGQIAGVVFSDFQYQYLHPWYLQTYYQLLGETTACAVLYPDMAHLSGSPVQPSVTRGRCIVDAVHVDAGPTNPGQASVGQWEDHIREGLRQFSGDPVALLAYDQPTKSWPNPAPSNYLQAMADLSNGTLEVFG